MTGTRPAPDPPHASNGCARARSASSRFDLGRTCRTHTASPAVEAAARPVRRVRRSSYDTGHVPPSGPPWGSTRTCSAEARRPSEGGGANLAPPSCPNRTRPRTLGCGGGEGEEGCACSGVHSTEPLGELQGLQGLRTVCALNLPTLPFGQAPSQSWYSGLHSLAPCVGHLWKMNYYRASSTELSFAQGAATATAPAILLPLDPMPTHPREHPFSQESGTRLDLQARSSTMRRWTVAEEAGVP